MTTRRDMPEQELFRDPLRQIPDESIGWLFRPVRDLKLSTRASNCMQRAKIRYVGDLVTRVPEELLRVQNLGQMVIKELHDSLGDRGLWLGMRIPRWPPEVLNDEHAVQELPRLHKRDLRKLLVSSDQDVRAIIQEKLAAHKTERAIASRSTIEQETKVNLVRRIAEFDLSTRTAYCLKNCGVTYVGDLVHASPNDLLTKPNFGHKSLKEIENMLATMGLRLGMKIPDWGPDTAARWEKAYSRELQKKRMIYPFLRRGPRNVLPTTLEEELSQLSHYRNDDRNASIAIKHFGWDGRGQRTLQAVGDEYGITRERVRQITDQIANRLKGKRFRLPLTDEALGYVASRCPAAAAIIEQELATTGLSERPFNLGGLKLAAKLTGRECPFEIHAVNDVRLVVEPGGVRSVSKILVRARRLVEHWGCATIEELSQQVPEIGNESKESEIVRSILIAQSDFEWLDEPAGWFWLKQVRRNRVLNRILGVLAVAPRIRGNELRAAISRDYRMAGFAPPTKVLLEMCRQLQTCGIESEMVVCDAPPHPDSVLNGTELLFLKVLSRDGPVMARDILEEKCIAEGMNRNTFYVYLGYCPIIAQYGRGVYGLVGAEVTPGLIERLAPQQRPGKSLVDYGWTDDGHVWLGYTLSRSSIMSGVFHIPAGMSKFVKGEYALSSPDGGNFGNIVANDQTIWRLGKFFSRRGGEPGDALVLVFDLPKQRVYALIGGNGLLESFANGEQDREMKISREHEQEVSSH